MVKGLAARAAIVALVAAAGIGGALATRGDLTPESGELAQGAAIEAAMLDLEWEDLLPPTDASETAQGVVEHEQVSDEGSPFQTMTDTSLVRGDLDGKRVRIPGYMTPLTFEEAEVGEFLLVPYVGACVHVPPPPANQIVFVEVDGTVPVLEMWEPFLAVGTLRASAKSTELAEIGYTLELEHLEIYEEEELDILDDTVSGDTLLDQAVPYGDVADGDRS